MSAVENLAYPSIAQLLDEARRETGLNDFGGDSFLIGLRALLFSLEHDAKLPPQGRDDALMTIRRRLANRLKIEDWYARHPALSGQEVQGPIVVTGLTRTGSTALGNMLSLDPQFRNLRGWEQNDPVPPPVLGEETSDARRIAAQADIDRYYREEPLAAAQHIREVDASIEDTEVLGLEFAAQQFTLPVFSYFDQWRDADLRPAFAYHKRVTTLLQSQRPPRLWLFKAPHHKFHLDALIAAYPNARFIMTHRDPAKVVPSYTSYVTDLWPKGTMDHHDPKWVGPYVSHHLRSGMERAIAARERIGEDRFIDIHHHEINSDPFTVLERIYNFLRLELTPSMRGAVATWLTKHHSGAHGDHKYSAEEFGLTAAGIRADYDFYISRFGVRTGG